MKYGLHGSLEAQNGEGGNLLDILIEASRMMRKTQGCLLYLVSQDVENEDQIWVTEVWESEADHQASLGNPEVRALISKAMPILAGPPSGGQKLNVHEGW